MQQESGAVCGGSFDQGWTWCAVRCQRQAAKHVCQQMALRRNSTCLHRENVHTHTLKAEDFAAGID